MVSLGDFGLNLSAARLRRMDAAESALNALLRSSPDPEAFERLARLILSLLPECADSDMALANLDRWLARLGYGLPIQRLLVENEDLLRRLLHVFAASQYFADVLCRDPAYYELLIEPGVPDVAAAVSRAVAPFRTYEGQLDALRRAKRREVLRIGARDVLGEASFEEVVAGITAFADAAVSEAYRIARTDAERRFGSLEGLQFAVIAMGKLGGRELNYSSDVDLLFVSRDTRGERSEEARRLAERMIQALARATPEGYVFRVDLRLRPEGQTGPLVRSLDSCRDYYERHASHWERQALLKARFVAGDASLGHDFEALVEPFVYPTDPPPGLVEELRLNKLRLEKRAELSGERYTNVKDGYGGIRDIEFTVQLLQLLFGGRLPALRTGNTLETLDALEAAGLLPDEDASAMREAYTFLRTLEHRLQIFDERPVRCLPEGHEELERLARRMPRAWGSDPATGLIAEYRHHTGAARAFCCRFLFGPLPGEGSTAGGVTALGELLLAMDTEPARDRIRQHLAASGFSLPDRALADLERLAGVPRAITAGARPDQLARLARLGPSVLKAAAGAPDPDSALAFAAELVQGDEDLAEVLAGSEFAREVVCRLGGTAPAAIEAIRRERALLDMLFEPEAVVGPVGAPALRADLAARVERQGDYESRLNAVRRLKRRETLRLAAADVLAALDVEEVADRLTTLAEECLGATLRLSVDEARALGDLEGEPEFAVFGLGRLGGREMLYSSDLDLVFVCRLPDGPDRDRRYLAYSRLAALFQDAMTRLLPDGDLYPVDLRLRPEGKRGDLVPSLDACRRYYAERAQTWERQAMLKARFVAGDESVGRAFQEIITPFAYPEHPSEALADEIRAMKRRIEEERADPSTRSRDLKLGPGGLSDVEFLVQRLQVCWGHELPPVREPNTLAALDALKIAGLLGAEEATILREAYRFQTRLRNLIFLRTGRRTSLLPEGSDDQRALARTAGLQSAGDLLAALRRHREAVREVFEARF